MIRGGRLSAPDPLLPMSILHPSISLLVPLLLTACQTVETDPYASVAADKAGYRVMGAPAASARAYSIPASADADDLAAAALRHHPSLQATRARVTALEQSAIQHRSLPDPSASVGTGQMAETAAGQVVGTVGVQQRIPFPGKRSSRALIALRQADAMRAQLKVQELALAERVRNAYWDTYAANRTLAIVSESKDLLTTLRESVETRIAANKASQQDLLKLGNEITRLDQRLATAAGRAKAANATLNALLYRPSGASLPTPRAGGIPQYGSAAALFDRAQNRHPEVLSAKARISAAENGVRLAQLQKRPDLTAGVSWSAVSDDGLAPSANGRDQFMGTLGMTLPIWGRKNKAAEQEAAANLSAEQSTLASTRASLQQRIGASHARHSAEQANLSLYSDRLIPDARQSFDLAVTGYQTDSASFLDVIDAWRQLLGYRLDREENRARVGQADSALRFSAGLP